jgi:hypothetical protein
MFVMVKCGVLFEVRTEFLNIIYKNVGLKGLKLVFCTQYGVWIGSIFFRTGLSSGFLELLNHLSDSEVLKDFAYGIS